MKKTHRISNLAVLSQYSLLRPRAQLSRTRQMINRVYLKATSRGANPESFAPPSEVPEIGINPGPSTGK
ncbi:hypothetical protein SAY86_002294 [Trapa natans]|uniref:Uncharacterized protein n=1 Tax=Trapa natans TaxID=22666 RepID=A0AAN7LQS1_TRANT|nr:hypothetical protein SAY86_002294 [Trapa natans]